MPIIKQYSQVEAESLIKNYEENAKLDLVGLYPSARKFVEQLILAHDVAEKKSFDADIDSGNVRVRATPTTDSSTVFKLTKTLTRV